MTEALLLETRDVHIRFGGIVAAAGVSVKIRRGANLAIIGPNGAGKTTFLNICTGYLKPDQGSVHVMGRNVTGLSPRAVARAGVARAFQIPQLFAEHTAHENLLIAVAARTGRARPFTSLDRIPEAGEAGELLQMIGCADVADRPINELPEGQRKLIDIAVALALKPSLVLLDEPTSGVASSEKFEVMDILMNALRRTGTTSVFVEHDMGIVARYADEVALWNAGNIQLRGSAAEILAHPDVVRHVIGEDV